MKNKNLHEMYSSVLGQLNDETAMHSENVALMCEGLAPKMGLDSRIAYKIGLLHDVGKIYTPSRILKKNHYLTELERYIIDEHSDHGYRMLKEMGEPPIIYLPALLHHGFWKVRVMPTNEPLTPEILKYVYLLHAIDIYEAMTSKRAYHDPADKNIALSILKEDVMCTDEIYNLIAETDMREFCTSDNRNKHIR